MFYLVKRKISGFLKKIILTSVVTNRNTAHNWLAAGFVIESLKVISRSITAVDLSSIGMVSWLYDALLSRNPHIETRIHNSMPRLQVFVDSINHGPNESTSAMFFFKYSKNMLWILLLFTSSTLGDNYDCFRLKQFRWMQKKPYLTRVISHRS